MRKETAMSANEVSGDVPTRKTSAQAEMKVEVIVISVSDIDRAKQFYLKLGWRLDADSMLGDDVRRVQFTPPGSWCSIQFGTGLTSAAPGSSKAYLIVADIVATRERLVASGIVVGEFFHVWAGGRGRRSGSQACQLPLARHFQRPRRNVWLLQEVSTRLPGRVD